jgi:hypothetical protein
MLAGAITHDDAHGKDCKPVRILEDDGPMILMSRATALR